MIPKNAINLGEANTIPWAAKVTQLGSVLDAGGCRPQREVLPVVNNAATPTYTVKALVSAEVINGSSGNGVKTAQTRGSTAVANGASPTTDGKTVSLFAGEVAGAGAQIELIYWTTDAPKDANGVVAAKFSDTVPGL